jgi:hypothetical protein
LLWFSCYSWHLPTSRQLGAVEECWNELVIDLPVDSWEVLGDIPRRSTKSTSSGLFVSLSALSCVGSYGAFV